ncbi:MAG: hypothetical protein JWQ57_925 [Mucilaginibacter sp.]|nr:hypothetical protein [Mucilaginibacter sp.]
MSEIEEAGNKEVSHRKSVIRITLFDQSYLNYNSSFLLSMN